MKIIPLFILLSLAIAGRSQQKDAFYPLDASLKPTKLDSAHYFIRIREVNDSSWQWDLYNMFGPLIKSERYRDRDGSVQQGTSYYYDRNGRLDSTMPFRNGKRDGECFKYAHDSLRLLYKYVYRDDSLVGSIDVSDKKPDTTVKHPDEKESEYPGGVGKWLRYLNKNLKYPDRAINSKIDGEVRVGFIVDKEGNVIEPFIYRSVEYSLDDEAIRIVSHSGKWTPAFQDGRIVKSYKCQPIIYRLD